jgi:hypothetical protein
MDFALIKEHPYISGGVVIGGAVVLYLVFSSHSSSQTATTTDTGTNGTSVVTAQQDDTALGINAQLAEAQLSAQTNTQLSGDATSLGTTQANDAETLGLAQTNNALSAVQDDNSTQLSLYNAYYGSVLSLAQLAQSTPAAATATSSTASQSTVNQPIAQTANLTGVPLYPLGTGSGNTSVISNTAAPYGQEIYNGQNQAFTPEQEDADLAAFQSAQSAGYGGSYWNYIDQNPVQLSGPTY